MKKIQCEFCLSYFKKYYKSKWHNFCSKQCRAMYYELGEPQTIKKMIFPISKEEKLLADIFGEKIVTITKKGNLIIWNK